MVKQLLESPSTSLVPILVPVQTLVRILNRYGAAKDRVVITHTLPPIIVAAALSGRVKELEAELTALPLLELLELFRAPSSSSLSSESRAPRPAPFLLLPPAPSAPSPSPLSPALVRAAFVWKLLRSMRFSRRSRLVFHL